jgi:methylaspartate ammonia-lyase
MPLLTITHIHLAPQLTPAGTAAIALGLTLSNGHTTWGAAVGDEPVSYEEAEQLLDQFIRPAWVGQPATTLGELDGRLAPHPIPRPLAYAASQACWQAVAHAHGRTPTAQWLAEWGDPEDTAAVPLMGDVEQVAPAAVLGHMSAVAYTLPPGSPAQLLGQNGERLQTYVRQLVAWLGQMAVPPLPIYLDVRGYLGALYEQEDEVRWGGKLLGALSGLERIGDPHPLWVGDVALGDGAAERLSALRQLMRSRRLTTQLVGRAPLGDGAEVAAWLGRGQGHVAQLDVARFGSLSAVAEAIRACQTAAVPFILAGHAHETAQSAALLADLARATHPAFLYLPHPAHAYNHLQKQHLHLNGR